VAGGITAATMSPAAAAGGSGIGIGVPSLALADVGQTACTTNTLGSNGFNTSCTGDNGQPEPWSADFLAWDWQQEGIVTTGLTSAPGSVVKYGNSQSTLHNNADYTPEVGDAILYDTPADYVAMVTAINPDGSLQTVGGDWGSTGPASSKVTTFAIPAGQTSVGTTSPVMNNKVVADYVSPVPVPGESTSLSPFGAVTWTPAGTHQSRVDIYAADPHGVLWDFSHAPGSTTALALPRQVEFGWTHYTPVGVADFNHDGYPDLAVIDDNNSTLEVFTGTAGGLDGLSSTLPYSGGWSSDFTPFGVADWTHDGYLGVLAVQHSTNTLWFYPGDLTGGAGDANNYHDQVATGWTSNLSPVGVADITGDGHTDVLACDSGTKAVWIYPGDGTGDGAPASELTSCDGSQTFFGLTDYNGDNYPDLITRIDANGQVRVAPGPLSSVGTTIANGTATTKTLQPFGAITWTPLNANTPQIDIYAADANGNLLDFTESPGAPLSNTPKTVETGWTRYRKIGVADFNHDGYPDVLAIDTNTGLIEIFTGTATGLSASPTSFDGGWTSDFVPFGISDYLHAGHYGIVAMQISNGTLWFYPGDLTGGSGTPDNYHTQIGVGWSGAFTPVGVGYFAGTADTDVLTCRSDTNELSLYPGSEAGGTPDNYATDTDILTGDCDNNTYFGVTDYNNDGHPDVIVRDNTTGNIVVADGDGAGWWQNTTATAIATNW
jgi:hypothetical protein